MQESRSILIQQINEEAPDLLTIIGETEEKISLEDSTIWEIREKLCISSMKEYLDKFHPTLYQYLDTEQYWVRFDKRSHTEMLHKEHKIVFHEHNWLVQFCQAVLTGRTNKHNYIEPFHEIWSYCFDENRLLAMEELRIRWKKVWLEGGQKQKEKESELLESIQQYDDGNLLLYFYIQDKQKHLQSEKREQVLSIQFPYRKEWEVIPVGYRETVLKEDVLSYEEAIQWEDYLTNQLSKIKLSNPSLMIKCLVGRVDYGTYRMEVIEEYNRYVEFFGTLTDAFCHAALPIIEKIVQIQYFFAEKKQGVEKTLLVTNCSVEKLVTPDYQKRFAVFLESVNKKSFSQESISQAILPGVSVLGEEKGYLTRTRFVGNADHVEDSGDDRKRAADLAQFMAYYGIITFMSSKEGELAAFPSLLEQGFDSFEKAFAKIPLIEDACYLCPCYPNFTVISVKQAGIQIARRAYLNNIGQIAFTEKNSKKIWFQGLYVEAAYVAAGWFALYEQEDDFLTKQLCSLPMEVLAFPEELARKIQEESACVVFGFYKEKEIIRQGIVLAARTQAHRRDEKETVLTVWDKTISQRRERP